MSESWGKGSVVFNADAVGLGGLNLERVTEQLVALRSYVENTVSANPYDISFGTGDKLSKEIRGAFLPVMENGMQIIDAFWETFLGTSDALGFATKLFKTAVAGSVDAAKGGGRH